MIWIIEEDEIGLVWARCSNCGKVVPAEKVSDYCPKCKEKMEG